MFDYCCFIYLFIPKLAQQSLYSYWSVGVTTFLSIFMPNVYVTNTSGAEFSKLSPVQKQEKMLTLYFPPVSYLLRLICIWIAYSATPVVVWQFAISALYKTIYFFNTINNWEY